MLAHLKTEMRQVSGCGDNRFFGLQVLTLKISDDSSNLVAGCFPIKVIISKSVATAHASINQIVPRHKREPDNFETDVSSV